ncbi:hypothetical protein Heshes_14060 [Alicyclobacillus hesperidum]|uniref:Stage II sporulation protein M n=1 Tax=Alicyclobacillus hesperidum TaxID=89784 RepID=A0A1H2T1V4_9BACL|nr:stage II sporulation protein M [Alicyclobacillus hesperidum]GLV13722.1 hypothetical protein Heshes_14060 [Alicyclobacillus hesperidum]SDW37933.1 stage II sporulation protein M [Alicyclobacillus hesperidum]
MRSTAFVPQRRRWDLLTHTIRRQLRAQVGKHAHTWSFLLGIAVCGLVFGAIVAGQLGQADKLVLGNALEQLFIALAHHQVASGSEVWAQRALSDAELIGCIWLFGVSVIGIPFIVGAVFLKSFTVGFGVAYTTLQFGWKGFVVASIGIFAHQLIFLFTLFIASATAIRFSYELVMQAVPVSRLTVQFLRYTGTFLLCSGGIMLGASIQAFMVPALLTQLIG